MEEEYPEFDINDDDIVNYFGGDIAPAQVQSSTVDQNNANFALPGKQLAASHRTMVNGTGCYRTPEGSIVASVAGLVVSSEGHISVEFQGCQTDLGTQQVQPLPEMIKIGSIALARVCKVSPRQVVCDVFAVDGQPLKRPGRGGIRVVDMIPTGVDQVAIIDLFRPGDIIRAQVLALGLNRTFLLSTATSDSLGVIYALHRKSRFPMIPVNGQMMKCPVTNQLERRKVARPVGVET